MQNIYKEELSRAMLNKRYFLVFLLAGISFVYGFFQVRAIPEMTLGAITIWQEILKRGYYGFFACLMAVLPFADSLSVEKSQRFINYFLTRVKYPKFIRAKFAAVAVSGAVAVALPAILLLIVCVLLYPADPVQVPTLAFNTAEMFPGHVISPGTVWENVSSPAYLALCIAFLILFGVLYAVLAMGISFQTKNSLIVFGFPFLCYSFGYYFIPSSRILQNFISTEAVLIPAGNLVSAAAQCLAAGLFFGISVLSYGKKERQVIK